MNKQVVIAAVLAGLALGALTGASTLSQQPRPAGPGPTGSRSGNAGPQQKAQDDSLRLSVTLVQVDVVVTDDKGRQVTDLKPEDFEILEDRRPQRISNFSYITLPSRIVPTASVRTEKESSPVPVRLKPEQVRRTIAFVVDDLGLSFDNMPGVRNAIRRFVNEQMQPGDLVAILRTGAGVGALQQFTSDKRQLLAAAERLKWNPNTRAGLTTFAPVDTAPKRSDNQLTEDVANGREDVEKLRDDLYSVGTIGMLNLVVRGLRSLPGRKSVILFSDGIQLHGLHEPNDRVVAAMRYLVDQANRSSVVFYTIDAGGVQPLNFTAADAATHSQVDLVPIQGRRDQQFLNHEGLVYLARETGGLFTANTNDLNHGIDRAIDDQQGYYLIGYIPDRKLPPPGVRRAQGQSANKVTVNVKRVGYQVRSRANFFAMSDEASRASMTPSQQLVSAITSPFASGDVHLKLTSLFGYDDKQGAYMHSLMHIDAHDISYEREADGSAKGAIEIVAVTFGENGQVIDQIGRSYAVSIRADAFERVMKEGFIYTLNVPIKKAGAYQLRIAVRDARASKLGSANQFIDVPDISKNRLALSGIAINGTDPARTSRPLETSSIAGKQEGAVEELDPESSPAVRRLRRGMYLDYGYIAYNARVDNTTGQPKLESQVLLLRDGKPVYTGKAIPVAVEKPDLRAMQGGGRIMLGDAIEPGEYTLQIIVTDKLATARYRTASQWIDFEVVK